MEQLVLLMIGLGALLCMVTNSVLIWKILFSRPTRNTAEEEKTAEELELERKRLEQQRLELEGLQNINAYTGFLWKDGDSQ